MAGPWELIECGFQGTYAEAMKYSLHSYWRGIVLAQVIAAVFAMLCYRRQVMYGEGRVFWPLFVLVFGLPGWVGYRFRRSWPAMESCPECGIDVPRDRDNCSNCDESFAAPEPRGTEVFA